MSFACTLLWTIMGLVVTSGGRSLDANEDGSMAVPLPSQNDRETKLEQNEAIVPSLESISEVPKTDVSSASVGNMDILPIIIASPIVPETGLNKNENGNADKGILVPIVSVIDSDSSDTKKTNGNSNDSLVALPSITLSTESQIPTLPEIQRRSIDNDQHDVLESSNEIMDLAEDIVFRPLFGFRRANADKNFERNYRINNYRRYNVNGYYRIPYSYLRSNYRTNRYYDYSQDNYRRRST